MNVRSSRRVFLKSAGAIGMGATAHRLVQAAPAKKAGDNARSDIRNYKSTMRYREVGTTGIHVSAFSLGTGSTNKDVVKASLDSGINLLHASTRYMGGKSIKIVGEVLNGKTDKVHIALKDNFSSIEEALKMLGVNYVDFIMFNRHNAEQFQSELPQIKKQYLTWKDKGLVKHAGLTTHGQMAACVDLAIEAGFFACVMPTFGPAQFRELKKQRDALRTKKMSIIGMKTKGGLESDKYPQQIKTVLADTAVCTVNKGVSTIDDLKAWSAAGAEVKTGFWNRTTDDRLVRADELHGCILCGTCTDACPKQLRVSDVIRCTQYYHDAEKTPRTAAWEFKDLACSECLDACDDCGECERACPQHIDIRAELLRARTLWS
ncbi:MAG: hypothetical protein GF398_06235 [Chitinivibrionales bacterium]|nr:hypothetical protein [Chitinivibrionales bacterium]